MSKSDEYFDLHRLDNWCTVYLLVIREVTLIFAVFPIDSMVILLYRMVRPNCHIQYEELQTVIGNRLYMAIKIFK